MTYTEVATSMTDNPSKDGDVMEQIIHHIGEMGTYQRWLVLFMMPFGSVLGFVYCVQMFIAATPEEHWCRVPELQNLTLELRRNLSIPGAATGPGWDRCMVYDANWTRVLETLTAPPNDTAFVPCQNGWEFLYNDIPYQTVTSEREWVCGRAGFAPFAQFMFFVGSLLGCLLFGWMGDAYGRIPAFVGANVLGFVGAVATTFTSESWDFTFCRFLTGMSNDTNFIMIYILILEYVGPKHRTWVTNMSYGLFVAGSQVAVPPLALWLMDWRKLVLITALPMLLSLAAIWVVPESARWLASTGKIKRALRILEKFERINKRKIPEDVLIQFTLPTNRGRNTIQSLKAVLRCTPLRNSLLVLVTATTLCHMSIDAVIRLTENVGYNFFIAFAASAFGEMPAMLVVTFTIDRFGRRPVIIITLVLSAIFSFIAAFVSGGLVQMILTVTTRFFVNMAIITLIQMAPELLPTPVRATGTSIIHVTVFMCVMASPYIVFSVYSAAGPHRWGPAGAREFYCSCSRLSLATRTLAIVRCVRIGFTYCTAYACVHSVLAIVLALRTHAYAGRVWRPLPAVIVGCMCFFGAGISLLLPETMGQPMPQTIADGEKLARSTLSCLKPKNDDDMEELPPLKAKD